MAGFRLANTGTAHLTCLLLSTYLSLAQPPANTTSNVADGTTPLAVAPGGPAGAYRLTDFEQINLYNGHLNINLPILEIGGRGDARFTMTLAISRPQWTVDVDSNTASCNTSPDCFQYQHRAKAVSSWNPFDAGYGPGMLVFRRGGEKLQTCGIDTSTYRFGRTFSYMVFLAPDGSEHALYDVLNSGNGIRTLNTSDCSWSPASALRGDTFVSRDGSGMTFKATAYVNNLYDDDNPSNYPNAETSTAVTGDLMMRDGARYEVMDGLVRSIRDRNGNKISFTYIPGTTRVNQITDAMNRTFNVAYDVSDPACGVCDVITFLGASGQSWTIRVTKALPENRLRRDFSATTNLFSFSQGASGPGLSITSVVLPDSRTYQFFYTNYGEVARVELPTGGAVEYEHGQGLAGSVAGVYSSGQVMGDLLRP